MEAQKVTELTIEEEDKEYLNLPLLVSSRCVSSEFPTRFCSKALGKYYNLVSSGAAR